VYQNKSRRCDNRIVSISQPYVRPIIRGKQDKPVEFGAKISVSLTGEGLARVDHLRWDAFHEGGDLISQVQAYRRRYGVYPEAVLGDPIYGTRANRRYLKQHAIRFAGKPLGRPRKVTEANRQELRQLKAQRREEYLQRIPIEGKFGQGKNGYDLNYIRAKRADTSEAWINSIFLVMNLQILLRIFFALLNQAAVAIWLPLSGSGSTDGGVTGTGNLIIGYNETGNLNGDDKSGSHMLVVGRGNSYSSYGGIVAGLSNTTSGIYSSVSGGYNNTANGDWASVSGGYQRDAVADVCWEGGSTVDC